MQVKLTGKGEDERANGGDAVEEAGAEDDAGLFERKPVTCGGGSGTFLDAGRDGEREEGREDGKEADPAEDRDAAKRGDERKGKDGDRGDDDENGSARAVGRKGVEAGRETVHGGARDKDHEEGEAERACLGAKAAKHDFTGVGDRVDLGMGELELTDHDGRPSGDDAADDEDNDAGHDAERVEDGRDAQDAQSDLRLGQEDGGTLPADRAVVGTVLGDLTKDGVVSDVVGGEDAARLGVEVLLLVHVAELDVGRVVGGCRGRGRDGVRHVGEY